MRSGGLHRARGRSGGVAVAGAGLCILLSGPVATAQERPVDARGRTDAKPPMVELRIRLRAEGDTTRLISGAQVWVHLVGGGRGRSTPAQATEVAEPGTYRAQVDAGGSYELRISTIGYAPEAHFVRIGDSGAEIDLHLRPAPVPVQELVTWIEADPRAEQLGHAVHRVELGDRAAPFTTLADGLAGVPGVELRRRGGGGPQSITVRGSRPEAVLVLLDGVPLNDPLTGQADLSGIPARSLESATVILGATAVNGPGATAGVVSLHTRSAARGTTAALTAGSFGSVGVDLSTGTSGRLGKLGVGARLHRSDNDYTFENRISPDHRIERRRNADRRSAHLTIAGQLRDTPLRAVGRIDAVERGSPGRMGTRLFDQARWEELAGQLALSAEDEAGSGISAGYVHRMQRYTDRRIDREESLNARHIRLQGRWRPGISSPWALTVYAANEHVAGATLSRPTGRWMGGLTASRVLGSPELQAVPSVSVDADRGDARVSPALSLGGQLARHARAWVRAGQAYRIPTFADLYLASSYRVRPDPGLRPERVDLDAEIGLEWMAAGVRARGSGFFRRTSDPIVWLPSSTAVWAPRNAGRLTATGGEAELKLSPAPGWQIGLTGTWTRSRVRFDADRAALPYQPEWSGGILIEKSSGSRRALLRLRYTGSRPTSVAATHQLPAYALVDIGGRQIVRLGEADLEIELGIRNVLDEHYELVELFPEPGRELTVRVGIRTRSRPGLPLDRDAGNMHVDGSTLEVGNPAQIPHVPVADRDGDPSDIPPSRGGGGCTER